MSQVHFQTLVQAICGATLVKSSNGFLVFPTVRTPAVCINVFQTSDKTLFWVKHLFQGRQQLSSCWLSLWRNLADRQAHSPDYGASRGLFKVVRKLLSHMQAAVMLDATKRAGQPGVISHAVQTLKSPCRMKPKLIQLPLQQETGA